LSCCHVADTPLNPNKQFKIELKSADETNILFHDNNIFLFHVINVQLPELVARLEVVSY